MWRSPDTERGVGKKYTEHEIAALIYPLDMVLDTLKFGTSGDAVNEPILQRMEKDELVFGFYQLFQALLTDLPIPKGEHPGYQEAMVAELLAQMYADVEMECLEVEDRERGVKRRGDEGDEGRGRRAAWTSYMALVYPVQERDPDFPSLVERLELDPADPEAYLSPRLTREKWEDILPMGSLFNEFLWDTDWQVEIMLDLPEEATRQTRELMGYDLETVHRLPPRPSPEELVEAERYLRQLGTMIPE